MVIDAVLACLINVHYLIFLSMVHWFMNMHIFYEYIGNRSIEMVKVVLQMFNADVVAVRGTRVVTVINRIALVIT